MRSKKTSINMIVGFLYEITSMVIAFILPRLVLTTFGSQINGLTSAIVQFLSYASLLHSGINGVTRAALYKPFTENDQDKINAIVKSTELFMRKVAIIYIVFLLGVAVIYPLIVIDEFDWLFTFTLVLIIGSSSFLQYMLGVTYRTLLQAGQVQFIAVSIEIGTLIINLIVTIILINFGKSIHIVKLGSALVFLINPIAIHIVAKRKFKINTKVEPDNSALKERWNAFFSELSRFLTSNVDLVLLSFFVRTEEISVYVIYALVARGLNRLSTSFVFGLEDAFGNMISKNENEALTKNFRVYNFLLHTITSIVLPVSIVLIVPFVKLYTSGVIGANYDRFIFGLIFLISVFYNVLKFPYESLIRASGNFRTARKLSVIEVLINLVLTISLVSLELIYPGFGLVGAVIGTLFATGFKYISVGIFTYRHIDKGTKVNYFVKQNIITMALVVSLAFFGLFIGKYILFEKSISTWILGAAVLTSVAAIVTFIVSSIFYKVELKNTFSIMKRIIKRN